MLLLLVCLVPPAQGWISPFERQSNHLSGKEFHTCTVVLENTPGDYLPCNRIWKISFPWAPQNRSTLAEIAAWVSFVNVYQEENSETALGFSLFSLKWAQK